MPSMRLQKVMWVEKRAKTLSLWLLAALVATTVGVLFAAGTAHATTFTVNSTGDVADPSVNGACDVHPLQVGLQCTLRAAIQEANNPTGSVDVIAFDIPTSLRNCNATTKVCTILVNQALPEIRETVRIDGYTQEGASVNRATGRTDAQLKIELRPADPSEFMDGLRLGGAPNSVIRGLVINGFSAAGIHLGFGTKGVRIEGNFLGTDPTGTQRRANHDGVQVFGSTASGNTIGGTSREDANLISGNNSHGVWLRTSGNRVVGNIIGTQRGGSSDLGNLFSGIAVFGSSSTIKDNIIAFSEHDPGVVVRGFGDTRPDDGKDDVFPANGNRIIGNTIFSNGAGVKVQSLFNGPAHGNRILSNSIFANSALGIDLVPSTSEGVTANDLKDPDGGPNRLQNFPVLNSARNIADGTTSVSGRLNSRPGKSFIIQFFSSPQADPTGFGEGQEFIGQKSVTTDANGNASFTFKSVQQVSLGDFVTATATDSVTGDTSEFSIARKVVLG